MKIKVNEQIQTFYLSSINTKTGKYKWNKAHGHGLEIGKYKFCAIPTENELNISEVSTGSKLITYPITHEMLFSTGTKDDFVKYVYKIGEKVAEIIKGTKDFDKKILLKQRLVKTNLEEKPVSENIDLEGEE